MNTESFRIRVECYAGYRSEETPRRFFIGGRAIRVENILDRWIAPDHRYFKVRGDDGGVYILRYDDPSDTWALTLFNNGTFEEIRLSST